MLSASWQYLHKRLMSIFRFLMGIKDVAHCSYLQTISCTEDTGHGELIRIPLHKEKPLCRDMPDVTLHASVRDDDSYNCTFLLKYVTRRFNSWHSGLIQEFHAFFFYPSLVLVRGGHISEAHPTLCDVTYFTILHLEIIKLKQDFRNYFYFHLNYF